MEICVCWKYIKNFIINHFIYYQIHVISIILHLYVIKISLSIEIYTFFNISLQGMILWCLLNYFKVWDSHNIYLSNIIHTFALYKKKYSIHSFLFVNNFFPLIRKSEWGRNRYNKMQFWDTRRGFSYLQHIVTKILIFRHFIH